MKQRFGLLCLALVGATRTVSAQDSVRSEEMVKPQ